MFFGYRRSPWVLLWGKGAIARCLSTVADLLVLRCKRELRELGQWVEGDCLILGERSPQQVGELWYWLVVLFDCGTARVAGKGWKCLCRDSFGWWRGKLGSGRLHFGTATVVGIGVGVGVGWILGRVWGGLHWWLKGDRFSRHSGQFRMGRWNAKHYVFDSNFVLYCIFGLDPIQYCCSGLHHSGWLNG